jgi:hypothetical protein
MSTNSLFQLTFPDTNWKETTTYTFEGPNDSGVRHNLVLVILDNIPKETPLNEYAKVQCDIATHLLPNFEYVEEKWTDSMVLEPHSSLSSLQRSRFNHAHLH